jgi:para-nitrobenzyl esterase
MAKCPTDPSTAPGSERRRLLKMGGLGAAAVILNASVARAAPSQAASGAAEVRTGEAARPLLASKSSIFSTAETTYGRVQGYILTDVTFFQGIPYGANTGGKNRFMPPQRPSGWTGVRECFKYGQVCPQTSYNRSAFQTTIEWDKQPGGFGEDCLVANVWTPGVGDGAKRPVIVWFHGGGYTAGSGNTPMFDGQQLARYGDVVVVTVNHRLGAFGYTHLAGVGAPGDFKYAGVCGLMDLVAALEWVRDNAVAFGGDPNRVLIAGHSGGGFKVSALLAMPRAKGLFHAAGVHSGSAIRLQDPEHGAKTAAALLDKLGISKNRIADIQKVSWQQILEAQAAVGSAIDGNNFSPVIGTDALLNHPFDPAAPAVSADVPMIVSNELENAALSLNNFDIDEAGLRTLLNQRFPRRGEEIVALYRKRYPNKSAFLIQAQVLTDVSFFRVGATLQAERKAAQGRAPVWLCDWDWPSPAYDGAFGAIHGTMVSAMFHNYYAPILGGGRDARQMTDRMASSFIAFARTGDPNNSLIPNWATFDAKARSTMVFDTETRLENDPRAEIRAYWASQSSAAG